MAARRIVTAENPLLRKRAKRVRRFGEGLGDLVKDMFDSMHAANGLGLAASQIGVLQRVLVVEIPAVVDEDGKVIEPSRRHVLVNPKIVKMSGEEEMEEGCLSVPGYRGLVKRGTLVTIKGQDLKGKTFRLRGDGLLAQAFQHELDHLDGVLFLDRVESPDNLWRIEHVEEDSFVGS